MFNRCEDGESVDLEDGCVCFTFWEEIDHRCVASRGV